MLRTLFLLSLAFVVPAAGQNPGIITTVAGVGVACFNGDDIAASQACLNFGQATTPEIEQEVSHPMVDAAGNLFIPDHGNHRVRRVGTNGIVTTFAGSGARGFAGDGGPAGAAAFDGPNALVMDSAGNIYISDQHNSVIRRVTPSGVVSRFAGSGSGMAGFGGNGGLATSALLDFPAGLAFDRAGNLYISDTFNNQVRRVTPDGVINGFAGTLRHGFGGDGGQATRADLAYPMGLAFDSAGNLYIADEHNNRIRRVTPDGMITTFAGTGPDDAPGSFGGDGGPANRAQLNYPADVAFDAAGNLYIADQHNHRIRRVSPEGVITTVAGNGAAGFAGDGGPATEASLNSPSGIAIDANGDLYITDHYNHRIRKVSFRPSAPANGITNAASFASGPIAPGQIVSIFGTALGPQNGVAVVNLDPATGRLPTSVAGVTVLFNDIPGALFFVRHNQINVQAPYEIAGQAAASVVVRYQNASSPPVTVAVAAAGPGIFTATQTGRGQASLLNQDSTVNSASNPATRGSTVQIFLTGQGQTNPAAVTGAIPQAPFPTPAQPVMVSIGGRNASFSFAGLAPCCAGLLQINAVVPEETTPGDAVPLAVTIGGVASQSGVTMAVR